MTSLCFSLACDLLLLVDVEDDDDVYGDAVWAMVERASPAGGNVLIYPISNCTATFAKIFGRITIYLMAFKIYPPIELHRNIWKMFGKIL